MIIGLILLGIIVILILMTISLYNRLVKLRNNREQAFADVDVQLKQRHDMIPQLVDSVKAAETRLSTALDGLKVAVEAYPDLKASQNFMELQNEIADVENKIAAARRFFNSATKELNVATEMFPSNLIATLFNFKREPMFELGEQRAAAEEPPKINF
jgi:LemA protein